MKSGFIAMALVAAAPLSQAAGNGEHPAIVARRVIAAQGFDYASAFYRHPAGLELAKAPPQAADQAESVLATREHRAAPRAAARK